ncbi:hypothetical protein [Streptomyces sp. SM8]|uniref:hypothetical protein n=1 Tax=Streptomyces sp. SM8 TaxID=1195457 RepID=UPI0002831111|nr:hypothetical protein [Streptomyces sp. SM8]PKA37915.1 hypothetical protein SM8_029275 [Streptomyces sp. SM8]
MSFHRAELFEALADARWRNEPSDGDDLDRLIDNFAHELAEKLRQPLTNAECHEVQAHLPLGEVLARRIDPEVKK